MRHCSVPDSLLPHLANPAPARAQLRRASAICWGGKALEHIIPQGWHLHQVKAIQTSVAKHNFHTDCFSNRKERMGHEGMEIHCSAVPHLNGSFERNLNGAWHTLPHQDKAGAKTPSTYMWAQVNPLLEYAWRLKRVSNSCSHVFTQQKGGNNSFRQYGLVTKTP